MRLKEFLLDAFNIRCDRSGFFRYAPDAASVVSPARAIRVFDTLRQMDNIAYGYTDDGCYARAHLMCRRMCAMGLMPEKAWAFETDNRELVVRFPHGEQTWWFHVAPVLGVEDGSGGHRPMVFDPSLFDGPATLKEWGDIMKAEAGQISVVSCGRPPATYTGDYTHYLRTGAATDAKAEKVMREYVGLQSRQGFMPVVFPSALRNAVNDCSWDAGSAVPEKAGGVPCRNQRA
jgi:hypothetical protein